MRAGTIASLLICLAACSTDIIPTETNVVGTYSSATEPAVLLQIGPQGLFRETVGTRPIVGRWAISHLWATDGESVQLELVGFVVDVGGTAKRDPDARSYARLKRRLSRTALLISADEGPTLELIKQR